MLSKKLAIAAASAALVMGAFAPMAFADVNVSNVGGVEVNSTTLSDTGSNQVTANDGSQVEDVNVTTGSSVASNTVGTEMNSNTVTVAGNNGEDLPGVDVHNCGMTDVTVVTGSNSGNNVVSATEDGSSVEDVHVGTGNASAGSNVQTLVNVNSVNVSGNVTE